jgi:hypothetical protein
VISKAKVIGGLAGVGAAAVVLFPASSGAATCTFECGGGGGATQGLTTALTAIASVDTSATTAAETVIVDRLAGNHNETVLLLD